MMLTEPGDRHKSIIEFSTDSALNELESKYEPYFNMHKIDSIFDIFDIEVIDPDAEILSYKFSWNTDYELPLELKRDILALYNKHFQA